MTSWTEIVHKETEKLGGGIVKVQVANGRINEIITDLCGKLIKHGKVVIYSKDRGIQRMVTVVEIIKSLIHSGEPVVKNGEESGPSFLCRHYNQYNKMATNPVTSNANGGEPVLLTLIETVREAGTKNLKMVDDGWTWQGE